MHNNLPDETQLPNGQKFELLSLALLGVPSMAETFLEITDNLKQLNFDQADYVCLKFILLLNAGEFGIFGNRELEILKFSFQGKCEILTTDDTFRSAASR